jgi:hypothetical protein
MDICYLNVYPEILSPHSTIIISIWNAQDSNHVQVKNMLFSPMKNSALCAKPDVFKPLLCLLSNEWYCTVRVGLLGTVFHE